MFFLVAIGFIFILYNKKSYALLFFIAVANISIFALIEYLLNIDLKIDQLLLNDFIQSNAAHPGRMSIFTALAFALFSISLGIRTIFHKSILASISAEILSTIVIALGIILLINFIFGINQTIGSFARDTMGINTAILFILLGTRNILDVWRTREEKLSDISPNIAPALGIIAFSIEIYTPLGIASGIHELAMKTLAYRLI